MAELYLLAILLFRQSKYITVKAKPFILIERPISVKRAGIVYRAAFSIYQSMGQYMTKFERFICTKVFRFEPNCVLPEWYRWLFHPIRCLYLKQTILQYDFTTDTFIIHGVKVSGQFFRDIEPDSFGYARTFNKGRYRVYGKREAIEYIAKHLVEDDESENTVDIKA